MTVTSHDGPPRKQPTACPQQDRRLEKLKVGRRLDMDETTTEFPRRDVS